MKERKWNKGDRVMSHVTQAPEEAVIVGYCHPIGSSWHYDLRMAIDGQIVTNVAQELLEDPSDADIK